MKKILFLTIIAMSFILFGCNQQNTETTKQPEIPEIKDWNFTQTTIVEDEVWFSVKKEYKDKIITAEDFPMLEIKALLPATEIYKEMYSEIYPDGNIPELATRHYCIYLKDKSEQLVYSAVEAIEDLEFIDVAYPNVYIWLA